MASSTRGSSACWSFARAGARADSPSNACSDNVSALGLTIDYGPYAWMDIFKRNHICNHSSVVFLLKLTLPLLN
jgi:hypothetical protein